MPDTNNMTIYWRTIGLDFGLCQANAYNASRYMKEPVTVYAIGRGKAERFFFRLKNDPREVDDMWRTIWQSNKFASAKSQV